MTECPQCGAALPEARGVAASYAPVWAMCRSCAWPLKRDAMIERLLACRAEVKTVVMLGQDGSGMQALIGDEAHAAVDGLAGEADALVPVCEAAGLVAFQRSGLIEYFLFEGESVQRALAVMSGR